jgi:hypothetical protein
MGMTPAVSQQDQFLSYWFRDCEIEFQSGVSCETRRGGSMNFLGGSYNQALDRRRPALRAPGPRRRRQLPLRRHELSWRLGRSGSPTARRWLSTSTYVRSRPTCS